MTRFKERKMQKPLEMSFRGFLPPESVKEVIRRKAAELDKVHDALIGCRVAVERVQATQKSGNPYRVRIDLTIPNHELVVRRELSEGALHDPLHSVLRNAFNSARRLLKDRREIRRRQVKAPADRAYRAVVKTVLPDRDHGFMRDSEGREIYFHRNSVIGGKFEDLRPGMPVRYVRQEGEKGLQASTVEITGAPSPPRHSRARMGSASRAKRQGNHPAGA